MRGRAGQGLGRVLVVVLAGQTRDQGCGTLMRGCRPGATPWRLSLSHFTIFAQFIGVEIKSSRYTAYPSSSLASWTFCVSFFSPTSILLTFALSFYLFTSNLPSNLSFQTFHSETNPLWCSRYQFCHIIQRYSLTSMLSSPL